MTSNDSPLEFPLDCHYKVITEEIKNMPFVIETVLMGLGIAKPEVRAGNRSKKGKYITFNITLRVESKTMMDKIDTELRNIAGVRMVL